MDEDTSIINSKTRNEKIKNFLIDNRKTLISSITILIAIIISFYFYQIYLDKKRVQISNIYNSAIIDYQDTNKSITASKLKDIINNKDRIAQMILTPVIKMDLEETDNLPDTVRGVGGFGSTGKWVQCCPGRK